MQGYAWRWLRLLALILFVAWLGQRFFLENQSQLNLPWLNQPTQLEQRGETNFIQPNSDESQSKSFKLSTSPTFQPVITTQPTIAQPAVTPDSPAADSTQSTPQSTSSSSNQSFPYISDTDVLVALNQYRADHQVHQLVEQQNLCQYAQKRVDDLVSFGGLDHHEGFKQDFEGDEIPEPLRDYPGSTIGENLAYQHCINMQTGDSFIANSAAALIEWCFDSSTAGHKEAQLNPKFNNVCVRHQDGLFVVIFGD